MLIIKRYNFYNKNKNIITYSSMMTIITLKYTLKKLDKKEKLVNIRRHLPTFQ